MVLGWDHLSVGVGSARVSNRGGENASLPPCAVSLAVAVWGVGFLQAKRNSDDAGGGECLYHVSARNFRSW